MLFEFSLLSFLGGAGVCGVAYVAREVAVKVRGDKAIAQSAITLAEVHSEVQQVIQKAIAYQTNAKAIETKVNVLRGESLSTELELVSTEKASVEETINSNIKMYLEGIIKNQKDPEQVKELAGIIKNSLANALYNYEYSVRNAKSQLQSVKDATRQYDSFNDARAQQIHKKERLIEKFTLLREKSDGILDEVIDELIDAVNNFDIVVPQQMKTIDFDEDIHEQVALAYAPLKRLDKAIEKMSQVNYERLEGFVKTRKVLKAAAKKAIGNANEMVKRYDLHYVNTLPSLIFKVESTLEQLPEKLPVEAIREGVEAHSVKDNELANAITALIKMTEDLDNYREKAHLATGRIRDALRRETTRIERMASRESFNELVTLLAVIESQNFDSGSPIDRLREMLAPVEKFFKVLGISMPVL